MPLASAGATKDRAKSASSFDIVRVGITRIQWELTAPVWWALQPRTTMPSLRFSTMRQNRSGSACLPGLRPRSPLTSVMAPSTVQSSSCILSRKFRKRLWYSVPSFLSISKVVLSTALMASMPTQRWKQAAVFWPMRRCIFTFFTRSSGLWCRWQKRLILLPVREDLAVISSAYCGSCASV